MPKTNWRRSKCSVHLPRSKLVEIRPKMSGTSAEEGPSCSGSGPRMTVETLSPSPAKGDSKEISTCDGCLHPLKENTKANKVNEAVKGPILPQGPQVGRLLSVRESSAKVSEWDERLLPSSQIRNKENKEYPKKGPLLTGTMPKKKLSGEGQGWKGFSEDVSLYKNLNTPMQPSKSGIAISSDKDDLANRKKGAIKKKTQMSTGNPLKRSHASTIPLKNDNPRQAENGTFLENKDAVIKEKLNDPMWCNLSSEDFVFQHNLDNKILVKTVMPKFLTKLQPSTSADIPHEDPKSLQSQWIPPQTSDGDIRSSKNQDKVAMDTLMPKLVQPPPILNKPSAKNPDPLSEDLIIIMSDDEDLPIRVPSKEKFSRDPMWSSTFIRLKDSKKKANVVEKPVEESVWHKDNLCEVSMRDIMDPDVPPSTMEGLRSVEAICMRLRGIDVPGNLGILQEAPTFEELFDVLNI
ncbi:uncharacterized protein LOC119549636 [Drosophila subpulchrella]|uniref:uncharacterized protein LOC119549636 n=1 Tax=Drosophila subpulchrella TaxID=1486046 RepID=UPI0018A1542F|nr:uncharacterized protein LOC119549636 [Drosophila subpulchrella]